MTFDPTAIVIKNGKPDFMFISSPCDSLEKAKQVLYNWQDHYEYVILSWWIKNENQEIIEQDICFNNAGQLTDLDGNTIRL